MLCGVIYRPLSLVISLLLHSPFPSRLACVAVVCCINYGRHSRSLQARDLAKGNLLQQLLTFLDHAPAALRLHIHSLRIGTGGGEERADKWDHEWLSDSLCLLLERLSHIQRLDIDHHSVLPYPLVSTVLTQLPRLTHFTFAGAEHYWADERIRNALAASTVEHLSISGTNMQSVQWLSTDTAIAPRLRTLTIVCLTLQHWEEWLRSKWQWNTLNPWLSPDVDPHLLKPFSQLTQFSLTACMHWHKTNEILASVISLMPALSKLQIVLCRCECMRSYDACGEDKERLFMVVECIHNCPPSCEVQVVYHERWQREYLQAKMQESERKVRVGEDESAAAHCTNAMGIGRVRKFLLTNVCHTCAGSVRCPMLCACLFSKRVFVIIILFSLAFYSCFVARRSLH